MQSGTTDSSSTSTGTLICAGGAGIAKKMYVTGPVGISSTSEDSCLRVTGARNHTMIEMENTSVSGKLFEVRSSNIGSWDIVDRTGGASRLEINTNGNFGFNTASGGGLVSYKLGEIDPKETSTARICCWTFTPLPKVQSLLSGCNCCNCSICLI